MCFFTRKGWHRTGGPWRSSSSKRHSAVAHREPLEPVLEIQECFGQFRSCRVWETRLNPMMVALPRSAPCLLFCDQPRGRSPDLPQESHREPALCLEASSETSPGPQAQRRVCSLPWLDPGRQSGGSPAWQHQPSPCPGRRQSQRPPGPVLIASGSSVL